MPDPTAYYEGDFLIQTAGAIPDKDKNDDGTGTAAAWTAWTAWTVDTGNMDQGSRLWRWMVDFNRFCCVRAQWI